jgi:uncharacterized protein YdhG (YjbR/CyaY superfamily)
MVTSRPGTVGEFMAGLEPARRAALGKLRAAIRKALPRAREEMLHGMPAYVRDGEPICAFASQKSYMALYLCDAGVLREFRKELRGLDCGEGCVRFRKLDDLPLPLVSRMLKATAKRGR